MKPLAYVLSAFAILLAATGAVTIAAANPSVWPDPQQCTVLPQDLMEFPRIIGIPSDPPGNPGAVMHLVIRDEFGNPIPWVEVDVHVRSACTGICLCPDVLPWGITDHNGEVELNLRLAGCCNLSEAVVIYINAFPIRHYDWLVSPDFDGQEGDCAVGLGDFTTFGSYFIGALGGCGDYTGDDTADVADFVVFGSAWGSACR